MAPLTDQGCASISANNRTESPLMPCVLSYCCQALERVSAPLLVRLEGGSDA